MEEQTIRMEVETHIKDVSDIRLVTIQLLTVYSDVTMHSTYNVILKLKTKM